MPSPNKGRHEPDDQVGSAHTRCLASRIFSSLYIMPLGTPEPISPIYVTEAGHPSLKPLAQLERYLKSGSGLWRHEIESWHLSDYAFPLCLVSSHLLFNRIQFLICPSDFKLPTAVLLIHSSCRRWGHRTAQIDGRLYIDGGMVTYNQQPLNYSSTKYSQSLLRPLLTLEIRQLAAICRPQHSLSGHRISFPAREPDQTS